MPITVVTGTPRSGTSLAMRALEAAGVPAFHNNRIEPNDANPHGFYEHTDVYEWKDGWWEEADGMAVKVPLFRIAHLPDTVVKAVVVMQRPEEQVRASLRSAFGELEVPAAIFQHGVYAMRFLSIVHANRYITADFATVVSKGFGEVADFLGLDAAAMDSVIDPSLRRF